MSSRMSLRRVLQRPSAALGAALIGSFLLVALVGPWLVGDPKAFVAMPHSPPSAAHWFGTTGQGQDVFAQTIHGARTSLLLGFVVGALTVAIGAFVGVASAHLGGRIDRALALLVEIFLVIPGLPLAILIAAYLPASPLTIAFVLIFTGWAWHARVVRSQALSIQRRDFILAAQVTGESHMAIIFYELLPNLLPLLVSSFIGATLYAIGAEVGLEYLGLGNVGEVTWGSNLYWAGNDAALLTGAWWTFVPAGLSIALVGFGLTLLNSAIDEISNPRLAAAPKLRGRLQVGAATPVLRHE